MHINCLLRFPFFKTNECFRFKHNCSPLITVLVTLLFFPLISTCESRTENDEPTSWGQRPSASADLRFAGDPKACCGGYRSRNVILYIRKITIIKFHLKKKKKKIAAQGGRAVAQIPHLKMVGLGFKSRCAWTSVFSITRSVSHLKNSYNSQGEKSFKLQATDSQ